MAKVLLFVIEDIAGPGISALGASLKEQGHEPFLVFIGKTRNEALNHIPFNFHRDSEYRNTFAGFNLFKFVTGDEQISTLPESFLKFCSMQRPDIIGFSTRFIEERFKIFFASLRKICPDSTLITGGHGPSVYTDEFLDMDVDYVIRGEGEQALVEFANAHDAGGDYKNIPNLAWREDGKTFINRMYEPLDLRELPLPLRDDNCIWHVENNIVYRGYFKEKHNPYANLILAGRGCIGSCSYCAAPLWRDIYIEQGSCVPKHRRRTNKQILAEADRMKSRGTTSILFMDDYFIRPYQEMIDFFEQWKSQIDLPLFIHFSAEQLESHPDLLQRAIDAGLTILDLALQSSDERFAMEIFHRRNDTASILKFFRMAHEGYLPIMAEFIDGYMVKDRDDLEAKLEFIRQLPFDPAFYYGTLISVMQLRIHPGSPLSKTWPKMEARLLPPKEFIYRAMLMHFRLIMDDDEFARLRENAAYKENPQPMLDDFHTLLATKRNKYVLASAKRLAGKEVYFFGCKAAYQAKKNLFAKAKPRAILVDQPAEEVLVDGLPVMQLADVLREDGKRIPIVIFTRYAMTVARKIKNLRPDYRRDEIIAVEYEGD